MKEICIALIAAQVATLIRHLRPRRRRPGKYWREVMRDPEKHDIVTGI